jgi:hypothetical protein
MHATDVSVTVLQRVPAPSVDCAGHPPARTRAVAVTTAWQQMSARNGPARPSHRYKSSRWRQSLRRTSICPSQNACSSPRASNLRKHRYVDVRRMALYAVCHLMSPGTRRAVRKNVSYFLFYTLCKLKNSKSHKTSQQHC